MSESFIRATVEHFYEDDTEEEENKIFYKNALNFFENFDILVKTNNKSILCYDDLEAEKAVKEFNKLNLKKEKLEAKLRAINL